MIIEAARDFALERHGPQKHGSLDISTHLAEVAANTAAYYNGHPDDFENVIAAAWLHDVLEDTETQRGEIAAKFGPDVAHLVDLLTDRTGESRFERHLRTYYRIRGNRSAVIIKMADRKHNHARSLFYDEVRFLKMYRDEYHYFKIALWRPNDNVQFWMDLDGQYERILKRLMTTSV